MSAAVIITKAEAKQGGLPRYYTGKPCKHGHTSERYVDGSGCVVCVRLLAARIRTENPELARARTKAWRERNPEAAKSSDRASWRKRYDADPEKFRAISRNFRAAHPSKAKAWVANASKAWKANNPDAIATFQRNRRARIRASEGSHTIAEIRALAATQRSRCAMCRTSIKRAFHADHITPLSKGGGNSIRNIQLLCAPCNLSKGAKDPLHFARETGRLL